MVNRSALVFTVAWLVLAASPVRSWGPSTHVALSEAVLERIEARPGHPLTFLTREPCRTLFVRSSPSPDLTASGLGGKEGYRDHDVYFHDRAVARAVILRALRASDAGGAAFGLGWLGHIEADRAMTGPGGIIYKDLFGLSSRARRRFSGALTAISKTCLDAIVVRDLEVREVVPHVDEPLLAAVLAKTPRGTRQAPPPTAQELASYRASFAWTCAALYRVAETFASGRKAFPEIASLLAEEGEETPVFIGFDEVVDRVFEVLEAALGSRSPPSGPVVKAPASPAPSPGLAARAASKAGRLASRGLGYLWGGTQVTAKIRQVVIEQSMKLVNSLGGESSAGRRLLLTFASDLINDSRPWSEVRIRARRIVESTGP